MYKRNKIDSIIIIIGAVASVFPVVLVDTLGVEYIEKALAINMVASAVGYILASPMAGMYMYELLKLLKLKYRSSKYYYLTVLL